MIEQIDISSFEIISNHVLCKVDLAFDYVEIPGPDGTKVSLQIVDSTVVGVNAKNVAISGTIIGLPSKLKFHSELKTHEKGKTIAKSEFEAMMRQSVPHETTLNLSIGDRVLFNYKNGIDSESEGRLLKTDKYGYVTLLRYETLYAKIVGADLIPLNGWVLFVRDQEESEIELDSGLVLVKKTDRYKSEWGTVVEACERNKTYMDNVFDSDFPLKTDTRIAIDPRFGHRIVYDLHAGQFKGIEAIKRKDILGYVPEYVV